MNMEKYLSVWIEDKSFINQILRRGIWSIYQDSVSKLVYFYEEESPISMSFRVIEKESHVADTVCHMLDILGIRYILVSNINDHGYRIRADHPIDMATLDVLVKYLKRKYP